MRLRTALWAAVALGLSSSCVPTCERVCRKALDCDAGTDRLSLIECEESCERQATLYELWEDTQKQQALDDHKRCVMDAECEELEDGVCYEEELYVF